MSGTRASWDEWLCDRAVVAFGVWTLLCNIAVLSGASLDQLILCSGVALVVALGVALRRRGRPAPVSSLEPASDERAPLWMRGLQLIVLGAGAAIAYELLPERRFEELWQVAVGLLAVLLLLELATTRGSLGPPRALSPDADTATQADPAWHGKALFGLALIATVATLVLHRPGADEAFYINMAVAAADAPGLPLLARDTLHGLAEPYPVMPIYRVQSFELLSGALSRLTGIPALTIAHLVVPALAAFLLPLGLARLFKHLAPRRWLACVAVVLLVYLFVGDRPRGYGNFGFVRLIMGKAAFCSMVVPLIGAYAIEFMRAPVGDRRAGRARWMRLALAQVVAVGLTSSALWIAPTVAGLGLLCAVDLRWRSLLRSLLGLTTCAYPIAAGVWLMTELKFAVIALGARVKPAQLFERAFDDVLGPGTVSALFVTALLAAWGAGGSRIARRFALVFPLGFLLLFWSPHLAPFMGEKVTGNATYWRVFWLVPLPALVALVVTAPLEHLRRPRWLALALTLGLASILYWGPVTPMIGEENETWVGWPQVKILDSELAATRAIVEHSAPGDHVLAPADISRWIPMLHGHPYPLMVRDAYISAQSKQLGNNDVMRRKTLTRLVGGGRGGGLSRQLPRAVERYELTAICLDASIADEAALVTVLENEHFERVWSSESFVVWALSQR